MSTEDWEGTLGKENCWCREDCIIIDKKDLKIAELERAIVDAKQCVKIAQEKNEKLQSKIYALFLVKEAQNAKAKQGVSRTVC